MVRKHALNRRGAYIGTLVAIGFMVGCGQFSSPSALEFSERQHEFQALSNEIDEYWISERETQDHGFRIPETCEETLTQAQAQDEVLANALLLAALDDNQQEVYDLLGKRIDLLKELDRDLKEGCR